MKRDVLLILRGVLLGTTVGLFLGWLLPDRVLFIAHVTLATAIMIGIIAVLDDEEAAR